MGRCAGMLAVGTHEEVRAVSGCMARVAAVARDSECSKTSKLHVLGCFFFDALPPFISDSLLHVRLSFWNQQ